MNLKSLFYPKALAVVGVSLNNEKHPASVIYHKNNLRLQAKAFAVNDRGGVYLGEKVYASVFDIPEKVDLAVIATRAEMVPKIMEDCIHAGVRGAVVISGGFSETGNRDLQNRIVSIAKEADFLFIGPNCLGIYSPPYVDTFFIPSERIIRPEKGKVTLISQSGGILVDHIIKLAGEGVGLSIAVSIGNKALIGEIELLDYFADEPETNVIAFYIEGFGEKEGRACVLRAGRCQKPVVVLKAGKTSSGGQTVSSHTASMAGDYEVFSSALLQYGVVETKDETGKPMIAYVPHVEKFLMFVEGFQLNQIPVAHSIEEAVHMAKALKRSQAC